MRYLTKIELAAGTFDGPVLEADSWEHAEELAAFTGVQLVGEFQGEDEGVALADPCWPTVDWSEDE